MDFYQIPVKTKDKRQIFDDKRQKIPKMSFFIEQMYINIISKELEYLS